MREILTSEEIAALTAAFSETPSAPRAPLAGVRAVDLANQERPLEGRLPGLDVVLGRFARSLRAVLGACFGDVPTVVPAAVGLVRFERLGPRLAEAAGLVRFRLHPLRGQGVLTLPASLVGALLQVACGGSGRDVVERPARELSAIEVRLLARVARRMLAELRTAWEPVADVGCELLGVETTPVLAAIAAPDELVVHVDVNVVTPGASPSTLTLLVPNAALDAVRPRLAAVRGAADGPAGGRDASWIAALRGRLLDVPVDVAVDLGTTSLTLARLLELDVGDVIALDAGADGPAVVRVAGEPRFRGAPGVQSGRNAVRITEPLSQEAR